MADLLRGSAADVDAGLRELAGAFRLQDPARAALAASVCGALIENGADPDTIAAPLLERLRELLPAAVRLTDACRARLPESKQHDESDEAGEEDDPDAVFEQVRREVAGEMPEEAAAWEGLRGLWPTAIAVMSTSRQARAAGRDLREPGLKIADHHEAGHWLQLILGVLDEEPLLVIEPATRLGLSARMSGVVENFQLHVLLMDLFPQTGFFLFRSRRIPKQVAEVAKGRGPQQAEDIVTGAWNLYTWQAIRPGLTLPGTDDYAADWVWGEGVPADIPVFEGHRVVLLGPPSYSRSWRSQRMFNHLPGTIDNMRTLSRAEVNDWLERMLAARQS